MDHYHHPHFLTWLCEISLMLYLDSVFPQHIYQNMQKYDVVVLTNISLRNPSYRFLTNCICIIF